MDLTEVQNRLNELEERFRKIEARNMRVEMDKAWEMSRFRIGSISFATWIIISLVFWVISIQRPMLNALIPTIGFYLSTRTFPLLKEWWVGLNHKRLMR